MNKVSHFAFAARAGGPDTTHLFVHESRLRHLFSALKPSEYCQKIQMFGAFFQVDGSLTQHGLDGVGRITHSRLKRQIYGDIGIPVARWQNRSPLQVREYYVECLRELYRKFGARIEKAHYEFDSARFFADTNSVLDQFLSDDEPYDIPEIQRQLETKLDILSRRFCRQENYGSCEPVIDPPLERSNNGTTFRSLRLPVAGQSRGDVPPNFASSSAIQHPLRR
jgi:hypothetical protein